MSETNVLDRPKSTKEKVSHIARKQIDDQTPPPILNVNNLQAFVDWVQKGLRLPATEAGQPMVQEGVDERTGRPIMLPPKVCEVDDNGNVKWGSGVVVPDDLIDAVNLQLGSIFEQLVINATHRMSESYSPDNGVVETRAKALLLNGEFVFEPFRI